LLSRDIQCVDVTDCGWRSYVEDTKWGEISFLEGAIMNKKAVDSDLSESTAFLF